MSADKFDRLFSRARYWFYSCIISIMAFAQSLTIVAAEPIPPFAPVTFNGRVANSANLTHYDRVAGFNGLQAAGIGLRVELINNGEIYNEHAIWTANRQILLNGKQLSQTPPTVGFIQILGIAKDSKTMIVYFGVPIRL